MGDFKKSNIINNFLRLAPLIVLFISVLNEFDLNYLKIGWSFEGRRSIAIARAPAPSG